MKKIIATIVILIVGAGIVIFIYRYTIIQYSAEAVIRKVLPDYIRIDKIRFDFKKSRIFLSGFKILNPPNFSYRHLLDIGEISCDYRMKGKNLLDGFEVLKPRLDRFTLNIERREDKSINLQEMQKVLDKSAVRSGKAGPAGQMTKEEGKPFGNVKISDMVKLPEVFSLTNGKIVFADNLNFTRPHTITFENIESTLLLKLDDSYTKVLGVSSAGQGNVNGQKNEIVEWNIGFDPTAPKLTMSSRFDVSGVNIMPFEPYYDKYSPFIFKKGTFSGTLIFDFDNGNIGSSNEIRLSHLVFKVKEGYENALFWDTTVPDLIKYFSSPYGEIIFDFKIKGEMANPKFYLGPISKQALTAMAIDKISNAIEKASKAGRSEGGAPASDIDKARDYIDLFKGLINKK